MSVIWTCVAREGVLVAEFSHFVGTFKAHVRHLLPSIKPRESHMLYRLEAYTVHSIEKRGFVFSIVAENALPARTAFSVLVRVADSWHDAVGDVFESGPSRLLPLELQDASVHILERVVTAWVDDPEALEELPMAPIVEAKGPPRNANSLPRDYATKPLSLALSLFVDNDTLVTRTNPAQGLLVESFARRNPRLLLLATLAVIAGLALIAFFIIIPKFEIFRDVAT